jgi:hypothetical protein
VARDAGKSRLSTPAMAPKDQECGSESTGGSPCERNPVQLSNLFIKMKQLTPTNKNHVTQ